MTDQAEKLRMKLEKIKNGTEAKVIAVVSGKGGVGKSNFSLNFALGLSQAGKKVLLFDMDIGMGNIDILMGSSARYNIIDMFEESLSIDDIIEEGPNNLSYISGGTGLSKMFRLDSSKLEYFLNTTKKLMDEYHYIIFDMSAGVSEDTLQFALAAHELFVITTPEPTSITDAYAMMKYFSLKEKETPILLVVNRTHSEKQATQTHLRLSNVVKQFLKKDVQFLGDLPDDKSVTKAVTRQIPFMLYDPNSGVSKAMMNIIERYNKNNFDSVEATSNYSFVAKLKQYFISQ